MALAKDLAKVFGKDVNSVFAAMKEDGLQIGDPEGETTGYASCPSIVVDPQLRLPGSAIGGISRLYDTPAAADAPLLVAAPPPFAPAPPRAAAVASSSDEEAAPPRIAAAAAVEGCSSCE